MIKDCLDDRMDMIRMEIWKRRMMLDLFEQNSPKYNKLVKELILCHTFLYNLRNMVGFTLN